jgi:(p)ppGpp synthase/HD superfamily hydrolase
MQTAQSWCIERHQKTNHYYDKYLPYEMHLRMVVQVYNDFKHLLPKNFITTEESCYHNSFQIVDITHSTIEDACWGHDLYEDARCSYNDIKQMLGQEVADIIYAVSNEKGKNRAEKANEKYYEGIRNTKGATFVKLCDRIANVQWGKLTKSRMVEKYKEENPHFLKSVNADMYPEMRDYLIKLFDNGL